MREAFRRTARPRGFRLCRSEGSKKPLKKRGALLQVGDRDPLVLGMRLIDRARPERDRRDATPDKDRGIAKPGSTYASRPERLKFPNHLVVRVGIQRSGGRGASLQTR